MKNDKTRLKVNRQNAVHSTGPRSRAGRAKSAKNAIKHGLTCASPVLPGEDPALWLKCLQGTQDSLKPKNFLEAEIARAMACLVWRQQRYRLYETSMTKAVFERHIRTSEHGAEIVDLRECCEYQKNFLKNWPPRLRLVRSVLAKNDKDCISSQEAASIFEAFIDFLDHADLRQLNDSNKLLVKAGYKACLQDGEELNDDTLYELIRWKRGKLNIGLRFIAKTVGMSLPQLFDSLDQLVCKQMGKDSRKLRANAKKLSKLEKEALEANSASISTTLLADKPEARTLLRMESHTARQIQSNLQQLSLLRGLESRELDTPNLAIGIAISNSNRVPELEQSGNTTTAIEEVSRLESADNRTFETASIMDNLSKLPANALS